MEIRITERAAAKIDQKMEGQTGYLKLIYDTDDCGCAVNGVVALWLVPELEKDDIPVETNSRPVYLQKAKLIFFDEIMTIDFSDTANTFQLKSPQQILNGHMSFIIQK